MKIITMSDTVTRIELTRRNLETLLSKLDDPSSARTLIMQTNGQGLAVTAVESEEHYKGRTPGPVLINGEVL